MKIEIDSNELHLVKQIIKDIFMATMEDNVLKILALVSASGTPGSNTAVLSAITGVQNTANAILAQTQPTNAALVPSLASIAPTGGPVAGGTSITITGANFTGATGVMFGLVAGTALAIQSDTSLTVNSPAQPAGVVDVQIVDAAGTSVVVPAGQFTYA